ncbi:MAG: RDD family protein [Gammaproteobacteria bacterium]|nr:RDD family protein [Gammaproteobacteria bacterium]
MLDTTYRAEIPGGIELEAQVVGPLPRFLAFALDLMIRGVIMIVLSLAMIPFGLVGAGLWFLVFFLVEWFYPVLFEVFARGQTPGKKTLGISVVHDDLTPVTFGSSLVRNLLRVVDFLPLMYLLGLISMICNQRFQRLGDLAAGTLVISVKKTIKPRLLEEVKPLAPAVELNRHEQTAMVDFLHRSSQISAARKQELASILDGVTHAADEDKVLTLQRIGAWYLGVR